MSVGQGNQGSAGPGGPNAAPGAAPAPPPAGSSRRPLGVVVASVVNGFGALVRQHLELGRIEAGEAASSRGAGAGMMAAAGLFGLFAVGFGAAAGAMALALVLPTWAATLIVAGAFVLIAAVLVLVGIAVIRRAPAAARTRETLKEDARWAKRQIAR